VNDNTEEDDNSTLVDYPLFRKELDYSISEDEEDSDDENPSYEGEPDAAETDQGKSDEHSPDEYRSDT
jgi:hypothetical protein